MKHHRLNFNYGMLFKYDQYIQLCFSIIIRNLFYYAAEIDSFFILHLFSFIRFILSVSLNVHEKFTRTLLDICLYAQPKFICCKSANESIAE